MILNTSILYKFFYIIISLQILNISLDITYSSIESKFCVKKNNKQNLV